MEKASGGRFGPGPQAIYDVWDEFIGWAATAEQGDAVDFDVADLGAPTPAPARVFGIGLNYRDHAAESNFAVPDTFARQVCGPAARSLQLVLGHWGKLWLFRTDYPFQKPVKMDIEKFLTVFPTDEDRDKLTAGNACSLSVSTSHHEGQQ